jgi:hypothetical protein
LIATPSTIVVSLESRVNDHGEVESRVSVYTPDGVDKTRVTARHLDAIRASLVDLHQALSPI